ncbi:hypothetical protein G3A43_09320 [Paraburkholderia aspalathi]|nr:hypothetical protein [Paraburkholderia aspalathi]MBK3780425.1 hypothetical protein [Paraburkholderia aspalathi]
MIRFFSVHNTATEGTHLHLCWTSYRRTMAGACAEMQGRINADAVARVPLFYDFGTGDSDLRRLDRVPCWTGQPLSSSGAAISLGMSCHA